MLALGGKRKGFGIAFLVAAGIAHEIMAKDVSSPQTTELNAKTRAPTLMKWVHLGQVEGIVFIAFAAAMDKEHRVPILAGGIAAIVINEVEYVYAKECGLRSMEPPTERHNAPVDHEQGGWVVP